MKEFIHDKFAKGLETHPEWADQLTKCKNMFDACDMPDHEEVTFAAKFFNLCICFVYASNEVCRRVGPISASHMKLSNEPSKDGAGNLAPHFRYIWSKEAEKDPIDEDTVENVANSHSASLGCFGNNQVNNSGSDDMRLTDVLK